MEVYHANVIVQDLYVVGLLGALTVQVNYTIKPYCDDIYILKHNSRFCTGWCLATQKPAVQTVYLSGNNSAVSPSLYFMISKAERLKTKVHK